MAIGRPRAFCAEKALDAALEVFWRKGFDGASLTDLTEAMGINRPSLYGAFGNKEELFRKALDRYVTVKLAYIRFALAAPSAHELAERLLTGAAEMMTDPSHPVGCLAVKGIVTCSPDDGPVREKLDTIRDEYETAMRERIARAKAAGELPADAEPDDLMRYLTTVVQGMAIQASMGATVEDLRRVADTALKAWPTRRPA